MNMNHMLAGGITVAKLNAMQNALEYSENLIETLISIISVYASEDNYTQKGLNHTLAHDFLEQLKKQNIIKKFESQPTDDKSPPTTPIKKFKPRLV